MNDLLNLAMTAHGGLERWKQVRNMQAKVTLNRTLWRIKGRPDGLSGPVDWTRVFLRRRSRLVTPKERSSSTRHFSSLERENICRTTSQQSKETRQSPKSPANS